MYAATMAGFLVCMKTVPGPEVVLAQCRKTEMNHVTHTSKLANKTFAGTHVADDTAACNTFQDVLAIPCHQMAVINDVFLALAKLHLLATIP